MQIVPSYFLIITYLIEVSDFCDSPKSHQSYEDVIKSPIKECYGHNLLPFEFDDSNNFTRMSSVFTLIGELPKEKAKIVEKQYMQEMNQARSNNNLMAAVSQKYAIDKKYYNMLLPEAQAMRNWKLEIHKNDPSWSFIIIYYKPLLQEYKNDQQSIIDKKNKEKEKELDII